MTTFLLHTLLPMILASMAALRLSGGWRGQLLAVAIDVGRELIANPRSVVTDPAKAVEQALIRHMFDDVIAPATKKLDEEIAAGTLVAKSPSMTGKMLDGTDLTVVPPAPAPEDFKSPWSESTAKGPSGEAK
jgi:hypothetical protein